MKILQVLTYYRPHVSGLTIYVERLSQALVRQGHEVTVLTSQTEKSWPRYEESGGVKIVRVPVAMRISKGVIMPTLGLYASRYTRQTDILHLHLPQFDAPGFAVRGKLWRKPVVLTYHCDLQLPHGWFNRLVDRVVLVMNRLAGGLADAVVTYTQDYAINSPFLARYVASKLVIAPPPVALPDCSDEDAATFRARHRLNGGPVIGISARLAAEKGVEVLLQALPKVLQVYPQARVLHAGPYQNIIGEEAYAARLAPLFARYRDHYSLLGTLQGAELTAFYKNLDVLVVSSLNSTESFGLVQIEAMQNGVPVCASNLPGVRQPVQMTGMGEVTPVGDADALAAALIRVLEARPTYIRSAEAIARAFAPDETARAYIAVYEALQRGEKRGAMREPAAYAALRQAMQP